MAAVASRSKAGTGLAKAALQSTGIAQRLVGRDHVDAIQTLFASAFRSTATRLVVAHTSCWPDWAII